MLNNFDFTAIEEMDPSLGNNKRIKIIGEGHKTIYDREVPFELRIHEGETQEVGTLEAIRVKVLMLVLPVQ